MDSLAAIGDLLELSGGRRLVLTRNHKAPDEAQYSAILEVPGGAGFVIVDGGGPFERIEDSLTHLADQVHGFLVLRDGP